MSPQDLRDLDNSLARNDDNMTVLGHVFCAALQGFVANRYFHDGHFQGSPTAAVEFALSVVRVMRGEAVSKEESA